jgi:hypothetical protein
VILVIIGNVTPNSCSRYKCNVKKELKIQAKNAKFLDFQGGHMQTTERFFCERFIHGLLFFWQNFILLF